MNCEQTVEHRCLCGGLLIMQSGHYICFECGACYCVECGGQIVVQGGCSFCLSCAASRCGD